MSKLTPLQQLAVDKKGQNIIVSAGAGSGKTTVLKERVLRILKEGINIDKLIILTFTNNAASEMKERIRKIINENPDLQEQAELIDSAYITTFDSFAQSLVKKYNYLLNISKDFTIVDASIISLEIDRIIEEIFNNLYEEENPNFLKLIGDFEIKNDNKIRTEIKNYYKSLTNLLDRKKYLEEYLDNHYSENSIKDKFTLFEEIVFSVVNDLINKLEELQNETISDKAIQANQELYNGLVEARSYDDLLSLKEKKVYAAYKNTYTDYGIDLKNEVTNLKTLLNGYLTESKKDLIEHYKSTKDYVEIIISILDKIDNELKAFKEKHNVYEFNDIALKAIELVSKHKDVCAEIKNNTYEIMIDEYQDTNDIQETFISYIQNNNVYMVGDIKQSIYRFRNANPYIFKKKYDAYEANDGGFKIDLNMNFRSREEVVNNINNIFNNIMFDNIGGANYKKQHQMEAGNKEYLKHVANTNYNIEILNYSNTEKKYSFKEIEAFAIADDILKRIERKEKVAYLDDNGMNTKDITYQDFCILVDKSSNFELLKKVLEFKGIPATIHKDVKLNEEDEIFILKSLITLIIKVKEQKLDMEFRHAYLSVARSYIYKMNDQELFLVFTNNTFTDTELYKKALDISHCVDSLANQDILKLIIDKFNIIEKLNLVGDINERITKLEYFINDASKLNEFGMTIYDLVDYFNSLLENEENITMTLNKRNEANSVTIMTIHGSKGLEYPYVYLPYLATSFSSGGTNSRFKFKESLGFITPFYLNGIGNTFMHILYKETEKIEELSEKIRLFYVALTRAKEKIILINSFNEKIIPLNDITEISLANANSFTDLLSLIKYKISNYVTEIDLDSLNITSDYNLVRLNNYKTQIPSTTKKLNVENLKIINKVVANKHFSKTLSKVVDKDLKKKLDFGTYMHYVFEVYDFKHDNLEDLDIDDIYKEKITNFLKHKEVADIKKAKVYKEHEIWFKEDNFIFHGFIDLLLEYEDHFDIIDYKLSNLDSQEYSVQLNGYKGYIEKKYQKPCNIYLYSINKDVFKKLD